MKNKKSFESGQIVEIMLTHYLADLLNLAQNIEHLEFQAQKLLAQRIGSAILRAVEDEPSKTEET